MTKAHMRLSLSLKTRRLKNTDPNTSGMHLLPSRHRRQRLLENFELSLDQAFNQAI